MYIYMYIYIYVCINKTNILRHPPCERWRYHTRHGCQGVSDSYQDAGVPVMRVTRVQSTMTVENTRYVR